MSGRWQDQAEQTNLFWLSALMLSMRMLGRTATRALLLPFITTVYFAIDARARGASRNFLRRTQLTPVTSRCIWRHMFTFASVSLDRLWLLAGNVDDFEVRIKNEELFDDLTNGALLITSHFGSFEIMRVMASEQRDIAVHILLNKQHNADTFEMMRRLDPQLADHVVDAADAGPRLMVRLANLLTQGHFVGIMADRHDTGQRTHPVNFMGTMAHFPLGPWIIAAIMRRPVILCFATFDGGRHYTIRFEKLDMDSLEGRSKVRAQLALGHYVARLEEQIMQSPMNWFNFFDFWSQESPTEGSVGAPTEGSVGASSEESVGESAGKSTQ